MDIGVSKAAAEFGGGEEIIDPPAGVVGPGIAKVAPPGVEAGLAGVEESERVDEAGVKESLEAGAFLGGVALFCLRWAWGGRGRGVYGRH